LPFYFLAHLAGPAEIQEIKEETVGKKNSQEKSSAAFENQFVVIESQEEKAKNGEEVTQIFSGRLRYSCFHCNHWHFKISKILKIKI
jgi:hypothetical protein